MNVYQKLRLAGIVPVVKIEQPEKAADLAKALRDGGINCAEITFRAEGADKAISNIKNAYPDMLVGAGTVLTTEQAQAAITAGAEFVVSPGFNLKTVEFCLNKNMPILPGCITPTEIEAAISAGLSVVKFFPAEQAGGLAMIKVLSGPFSNISFMPTGGIGLDNLETYLSFDKIVACGGSFMINSDLNEVARLSKEAMDIVRRVRHE